MHGWPTMVFFMIMQYLYTSGEQRNKSWGGAYDKYTRFYSGILSGAYKCLDNYSYT